MGICAHAGGRGHCTRGATISPERAFRVRPVDVHIEAFYLTSKLFPRRYRRQCFDRSKYFGRQTIKFEIEWLFLLIRFRRCLRSDSGWLRISYCTPLCCCANKYELRQISVFGFTNIMQSIFESLFVIIKYCIIINGYNS